MRKSLVATLFAVAVAAVAAPGCKSGSSEAPAADNTAKNDRDRKVVPTADNAVNSDADRDLTQKIRQAVMDDSTLSTNAHNAKIVVQSGTVTLVGPVASDAERARLEQIATAQAGDGKVVNQLEVTK